MILFAIILFLSIDGVKAAETTARAYITSGCNVRTGPGTQNNKITTASTGYYYNLVVDKTFSDTNNHYECNSDWYQIYYNGSDTAYVCGDHVEVVRSYSTDDVAPTTACEKEMSALGFPSSYWGGLCNLKNKFPNWQFVAIKTNADWIASVEAESACGKSYLQTSNEEYMDRSCVNKYGWDSSWKNASQKAVAYYMDPRNFLSERYIFQFEYQKFSPSMKSYYPAIADYAMSGASFYTYHLNLGNKLNEILTTAGEQINVNPVTLAALIVQELCSGTSEYNLYSGVYPEFNQYYNFYNIGVSDDCATTYGTTYCGLKYAKDHGWYGLLDALKGGGSLIANSYINAGQYVRYLHKFNVVPTNPKNMYVHQYMTNLAAPMSESSTSYNSYSKGNLLTQGFTFHIPVYNNMNATITNSSGGATGETPDSNVTTLPISTVVTSAGYKYQSGYISGISPGTGVETIKGALESVAGYNQVLVFDKDNNIVSSGKVGTGYKVQISNNSSKEVLEIVINGDTSGDGVINALDLLQVQKYILGTYNLTGAYLKAGDTSKDGNVNALDLLQVQKNILGTYTIEQ